MEELTTNTVPQKRKTRLWMGAALLVVVMAGLTIAAARSGWFEVAKKDKAQPSSSAQASASSEPKVLYWYDPMHPAYRSDKPGIAPDCGMALVPKYAEDPKAEPAVEGTITLNDAQLQMAGVQTVVAERKAITRELRTTAVLVANETRVSHVHVKTSGYIEQVYADAIGQLVHKGDKLFTLYSPELVAAEQEYLIARRGQATLGRSPLEEVRAGAASMLVSARQKLKLMDVTDQQIARLEAKGEAERELAFYSPVEGFITDRKAFPQISATPETDLYTLSDLTTIWANVDIYEYEVPYVHIGQAVQLSLSYLPGKVYTGKVSYIYPTVDPQTRTVKARVELANPGFVLKPQMFADATIHINYGRPLVVPQEAVLNAGSSAQVFVAHPGGTFEPRTVVLGPVMEGQAVVLSGLKEGEVVAGSGNFLLDSESRMKSSGGGGH